MNCDEAGEFLSALCDGETVPPSAAEHLGRCEACRNHLQDYLAIGVDLRRLASAQMPQEVKVRLWNPRRWSVTDMWQKGWEMIKIPRFAFASLIVGVVVLSSSLVLTKVRAHGEGTVLMLKVAPIPGHEVVCPLSMTDKKNAVCGGVVVLPGELNGVLSYQIKLLGREASRVHLAVRSKLDPAHSRNYSFAALDSLPETDYWFEPGDALEVTAPGVGSMAVTGEWLDHMPVLLTENQELDPGPEELRVSSPLLLRDNSVVGDLEGGSAVADKPAQGVFIYMPGEGRFQLSLTPVADAVQGKLKFNRLSFVSNGQRYAFITGTPIARAEKIWILHDANFKPAEGDVGAALIGVTRVQP